MTGFRTRRGAAGQQYAIMVGLVGVVALGAVSLLGTQVKVLMGSVGNQLGGASNGVSTAGSGAGGGSPPPPPPPPASGIILWGRNSSGKLGDGTTVNKTSPISLPQFAGLPPGSIARVAAGGNASYALTTGGTGYAWGGNSYGELGDGTTTNRASPTPIMTGNGYTGSNMTALFSGGNQACAILSSGAMLCWGYGPNGELGNGVGGNVAVPGPVTVAAPYNGSNVAMGSGGSSHTCLLTTGGAVGCTGNNFYGQLGDGTTTYRELYAPLSTTGGYSGTNATQISAGIQFSCMRLSTGGAACWGINSYGQIGNGTTSQANSPAAVQSGGGFTGTNLSKVAAGFLHACGLTTGGLAVCWGLNNAGQLGDGTNTTRPAPTPVAQTNGVTSTNVIQILTNDVSSCVLLNTQKLRCFGQNNYGQLGDGSTTNRNSPTTVVGDPSILAVNFDSGQSQVLAITP